MGAMDRAIAYAETLGREDGLAAASWYGVNDDNARSILAGLEDGDPNITETFPTPDLSGQWADRMDSRSLVRVAGITAQEGSDDYWYAFDRLCDAYSDAFYLAVHDDIERRARYYAVD